MKVNRDKENNYHLAGWLLFVMCAVLFIASALKNGDVTGLIGSIVFLLGCVVFIIPLMRKEKP